MNNLQMSEGMWLGLMGKLLYTPLLNILVLLYVYTPGQDLGLAIIVLTVLIRMVLYPSYRNSLKAQRDLQKIQPYIDKIKEQYKDDTQRQSQEVMKVYKEHNVNLFSSCLPLIIQLPILFALYRVFIAGLSTASLQHLYSWFPNPPVELHTQFLAFLHIPSLTIDLTSRNIYLAVLAGVGQFLQSWLTTKLTAQPKKSQGALMNRIMLFIFPAMTLFIALSLPSALALYWVTITVVMTLQQIIIYKSFERQEARVAKETYHGDDKNQD